MSNLMRSTFIRLALVFGVMFGMIMSPKGLLLSHDANFLAIAEAVRHAELAPQHEEIGHVHDDGDADEQAPGHSHGHNPGDHTHDTAGSIPHFALAMPDVERIWEACPHFFVYFSTIFPLDRPPRPTFVA